jgi:HSP20 family protein
LIEEGFIMSFYNLIPWRSTEERPALHHGWSSFDRLQTQFNDLFQELFGNTQLAERAGSWGMMPRVDVSESDGEIQIKADLPGIDEKNVDVTLERGILTIKGEKQSEKEDKEKNYHRMERSYGVFQRSIPLPAEVDADRVDATFENGVLSIVLPKTNPGPMSKHIPVHGQTHKE